MLTAAGVTYSESAASAKLKRVATASNTRRALGGSRSKADASSFFFTRRLAILKVPGGRAVWHLRPSYDGTGNCGDLIVAAASAFGQRPNGAHQRRD